MELAGKRLGKLWGFEFAEPRAEETRDSPEAWLVQLFLWDRAVWEHWDDS